MPIFGQKTSILSKLQYFMSHRSQCPFFLIFHEKIAALVPIFYQKYVYSLKIKTRCSQVHVSSKKRPFTQKHCALMSFVFNVFMKNPLLPSSYVVKKTSILSKLHYILGPKSQWDALIFGFSRENNLLQCPYFAKTSFDL